MVAKGDQGQGRDISDKRGISAREGASGAGNGNQC